MFKQFLRSIMLYFCTFECTHLSILVALLVSEERPDISQDMARVLLGLVLRGGVGGTRVGLAHACAAGAEAEAARAPALRIPLPLLIRGHALYVLHQLAAPAKPTPP